MAWPFCRLGLKRRWWSGRSHSFCHPWPTLFLIISSIPVSSIPSADAAGWRIEARVRGDYVKSIPRKPGFTDALTNGQHQRKPNLWNRTDPDIAT